MGDCGKETVPGACLSAGERGWAGNVEPTPRAAPAEAVVATEGFFGVAEVAAAAGRRPKKRKTSIARLFGEPVYGESLARQEGFEPPTFGSVERLGPWSGVPLA